MRQVSATIGDEQPDEPEHVRVATQLRPVEPADFVVLAVGVVVAELRVPHLVAHEQHRRASREQLEREEVFDLPIAQRLD